ncbi:hypothetical protein DACRYDRAFT_113758 [Dacryopinax primogenitus]|uniref:Uncharacterized protein n=1 Tax=Dacryopinax primogenitus (strain DJM 731) TaxID=1858805 RepID=M5GEV0_DACPD|nr:uncharacterized protein DACRYDRAFT_113758 [Dacryopinax primogenitus]EJU05702.1 hypothetical protein DACRYDRAFT_113758 [Dacryopinax primogenitus]
MSQKQHTDINYSFPLTSYRELAEAITELGVPCQASDIEKPTGHGMQAIYALMLEELAGISVDTFDRPRSQLLGQNVYREYYNDALTLQMFHYHLSNIAVIAGVNDFAMSDILRPEGKHTREILSALINFIKFKQERHPIFDEIQHDVEEVLQRRDMVEFELAREDARLQDAKKQREENIPKIQAMKERNDAHRRQLRQLHKTQTNTTNEIAILKEEKKKLTERLSNVQYEMQTAILANETQKSRIVQSPDRLKRTISEMSSHASQERQQLSQIEATARDLQVRLEHIVMLEQDVRHCNGILKQVEQELTKLDEADRKLDHARAALDKKNTESRELETHIEQLDRQLANAQDKLTRAVNAAQEKRRAAQTKMDRLREEYEEIAQERDQKEKLMVGKRKDIENLEGMIAEHLAANQAELKALLEEYFRLRDKVAEYQTQLAAKLGLDFRADNVAIS